MQIEVVTPFPDYAAPRVWTWMLEFRRRVADDFAPTSLEAFMSHWATGAAAGQQRWGIYRDGELGGLVTFDRWFPVVGCTHWLFCKRFWGAETTIPAIREATRQIFDTTGVTKLVGFCFSDNWQVIGTAKKLGWRREGWLRQQTLRDGKPTDMVLLGLLREDFDAIFDTSGNDGRGGGGGLLGEQEKCPNIDSQTDRRTKVHSNEPADTAAGAKRVGGDALATDTGSASEPRGGAGADPNRTA